MNALYGVSNLANGMRAVREGTLQVAEDIPESRYAFRPTPESRSVAETLVHIAWLWSFDRHVHEDAHLASLEGFDWVALLDQSADEELRPRTKAEIIAMLREEGDRFAAWFEQLPESLLLEQVVLPGGGTQTRFEMLLGTVQHELSHRAALSVVQRLIGIVPRTSRGAPQRRAA